MISEELKDLLKALKDSGFCLGNVEVNIIRHKDDDDAEDAKNDQDKEQAKDQKDQKAEPQKEQSEEAQDGPSKEDLEQLCNEQSKQLVRLFLLNSKLSEENEELHKRLAKLEQK